MFLRAPACAWGSDSGAACLGRGIEAISSCVMTSSPDGMRSSVSSNPDAHYNLPSRKDCNLRIPLWQLVRASSAAPVYFPPETLQWDPADPAKSFIFVDGGVTPYNNPAFLLYRRSASRRP